MNKRKQLIDYGKKLIDEGLSFGSGGNLSMAMEDNQTFLITPSGIAYEALEKGDLVLLDHEGHTLEGDKKPSSEWQMHSSIYKNRSDIRALVHTHSPYVSVASTIVKSLPAISYLIASSGVSSVPVAPYETFGTEELAASAIDAMGKEAKAVILANHGLIAGGNSLKEAFSLAREIEFCAFLYVTAQSTGKEITLIPDEKMDIVIEKFKTYGQ